MLACLAATVLCLAATALPANAEPAATDDFGPMASNGYLFLEVNYYGQLVRWTRNGPNTAFIPEGAGSGWGPESTRLIAGLVFSRFMEVKTNGVLAEWIQQFDGSFAQTTRDSFFGHARLIG